MNDLFLLNFKGVIIHIDVDMKAIELVKDMRVWPTIDDLLNGCGLPSIDVYYITMYKFKQIESFFGNNGVLYINHL